jgi:hypothetical protein
MWETLAIIVTLGGLEFTLWLLDRRAARQDHDMQRKQLEILDGILTELAIQNSAEVNNNALATVEKEAEHANARHGETDDSNQEHSLCNRF